VVQKIIFIVGPTASGKTRLANNLAVEFDLPILSMDSMQIYKELDIATSKPVLDELKKIKYFGINIVEPDVHYSTADYISYAKNVISNLNDRFLLIVGGTGLYYDALTLGFSKIPPMDRKIRDRLLDIYKENGIEYLYNNLQKVDQEYSQKIAKNDLKRIIRALEVYEITGKSFSYFHKEKDIEPINIENKRYAIYLPRQRLYKIIDDRVEMMFNTGLLDEAKRLYKGFYDKDLPSLKAIGYNDLFEVIEGRITVEKAKENLKQKTRNYAKRQITWFKRDKDLKWLIILNENELAIAKNIIVDNFNLQKLKRKKNRLNLDKIEFELTEFISSINNYEFILEDNLIEYMKNEVSIFFKD